MRYLKYLKKKTNGIDLKGKTVAITGANSGIGYEAMKYLLYLGCKVIMACRSIERASDSMERAISELGCSRDSISIIRYDQSDLESIRSFIEAIEDIHIDVFIFNAGIYYPKKELVAMNGYDMTIGTNFYGLYTLVEGLRSRIINENIRCVFVNSLVARGSRFKGKIVLSSGKMNRNQSYAYSKYLISAYTYKLISEGIDCYLVHPGVCRTNILTQNTSDFGAFIKYAGNAFLYMFVHHKEKGALPLVLAVITNDSSKRYITPRGIFAISGYPRCKNIPRTFEYNDIYNDLKTC